METSLRLTKQSLRVEAEDKSSPLAPLGEGVKFDDKTLADKGFVARALSI